MIGTILVFYAALAGAAPTSAVQCRIAYPPNTPTPKAYNICLTSGESDKVKFAKLPDIDSIRVLKTDTAPACDELESNVGTFMFDKQSKSLVMGPWLATGCYLVLWNEA